jgi:hypothetical protein
MLELGKQTSVKLNSLLKGLSHEMNLDFEDMVSSRPK